MVTYERAKSRDYPKPICQYCYVPCDPTSREYRGMTACPSCYDEYADSSYTIVPMKRREPCQKK